MGAISAFAGPTLRSRLLTWRPQSYPCVRGADSWNLYTVVGGSELSLRTRGRRIQGPGDLHLVGSIPRARGRPSRAHDRRRHDGAIPACAEPTCCVRRRRPARASHSRVCGADAFERLRAAALPELSLRAGPMTGRRSRRRSWWSYPRLRGADYETKPALRCITGRSLPAQGRHPRPAHHRPDTGATPRAQSRLRAHEDRPQCAEAIPACTGLTTSPCT